MRIPKTKIWIKYFLKSFIWLVLPLCIFGNIQSCSSYKEAGKHLTPYSVSVRGYYRSDGTYVRPHNRRPPGSVIHDAPYERKRMYMGLLFFVCLIGGGSSIIVYTKMSVGEIKKYHKAIQDNENRRREEEKKTRQNDSRIN